MSSVQRPSPVVDAQWLLNHQHDKSVKVLDASWYLPNEKKDAFAIYKDGHISAAQFFHIDECADVAKGLPHMLPPEQTFDKYVSERGIANEDCVVVYDQRGMFSAPRAYYTFKYFNHHNVCILNGGLKAYIAAGGKIETGEPQNVQKTNYKAKADPSRVVSLQQIYANMSSSTPTPVYDARSSGRFRGVDPEPRPGLPSGHFKGETSLPFVSLITQDEQAGWRIKSPDELRTIVAAAGITSSTPVWLTCGSGATACIIGAALDSVGIHNWAVYDGAWMEYASQQNAQIITGE